MLHSALSAPNPPVPWTDPGGFNFEKDLATTGIGPRDSLEPHDVRRPNSCTRQAIIDESTLLLIGLMKGAAGGHLMLLVIVRRFIGNRYFWSGTVRGLSLESTTKTANRLAGSLSLAFSLIL